MQKSGKREEKNLHPRNLHRHGYDFAVLSNTHAPLAQHLEVQIHGEQSIDFADPVAVKALNTAILKHHYDIQEWDIPEGFLCPPIPGRVDYIHYVADLLGVALPGETGAGHQSSVKMLDIGTGANGIYSLLAVQVYGWECVASDIDPLSLANVQKIAGSNPLIEPKIDLRHQQDNAHIFTGVIEEGEQYDLSVCNPPFHSSLEEALKGSQKKITNLARNKNVNKRPSDTPAAPTLNFGGQKAELWCKGGEIRFLRKMLKESKTYATQVRWFTTLVSKSENLPPCQKILRKLGATVVKQIEMKQGNKISRILAWSYCEVSRL